MDRRRLIRLLVLAMAYAAVVAALFWRVWTPIDGARRAFVYDAVWEYWGDLQFQIDALAHGKLPLWNPYDRLGYPFHADPQAGILYPLNWPLVALGAVVGPAHWLVTLKILFHFWLAALGMHLLLARRGLSTAACSAGACFTILCYPFTHAMFSALVWGMAWTPWMLLALENWAPRPSLRGASAVALAFGMCWLVGAPGAFWYALLVAGPYAIWLIVHHARTCEDRVLFLRSAIRTASVATVLFVGMVAAQMSATGALVKHTVRDQRDLEFIGASVFGPRELFGMLAPRMPGEAPYLGILGVFAAAVTLILRPIPRHLVLGGIAVGAVLLAWGDGSGVLPAAASILPLFGLFRRAHRYFFVAVIPLGMLIAEGLDLLSMLETPDLRKRAARFLLAAGAAGVVVFGCGVVVTAKDANRPEVYRDAFALALVSTIVSTWIAWLILREGKLQRAFLWIGVSVLALDLWHARYPVIEKNFTPVPTTPNDGIAKTLAGVPLEARIYDRELLKYRPGIRLQVRDLGGYEGDPLALARYATFLRLYGNSPTRVGHANVRYLLEGPGKAVPKGTGEAKVLRPGVVEVASVAPAVFWVDKARVIEGDADATITALKHVVPGSAALLERQGLSAEEATRATEGQEGRVASGRLVEFQLDRLVAEIDAPADGLVVVNEHVYPGWSATVDGLPTRIIPANGLLRGVLVTAGRHRIEMFYRARGYVVLALVSIASVLAAIVIACRRRRSPAS